jgi:thioredoxin 1
MITDIDAAELKELIAAKGKPVLVDFYSISCTPCHMMMPVVDEIATEMGEAVRIVKFRVDKDYEFTAQNKVNTVPNFLLFQEGQVVARRVGKAAKAELKNWITEAIQGSSPA